VIYFAFYRSKAETEIGERNKDLPTVTEALRSARDVLVGTFRANPKKLTEFGFDVSDSRHDNGGEEETPVTAANNTSHFWPPGRAIGLFFNFTF
jgi:hypothetical protein